MRTLLLLSCLLAVACLCYSCAAVDRYVVPDPRHAEDSIRQESEDISSGLKRTRDDFKKAFRAERHGGKGRVFFHVRENNLGSDLLNALERGISYLLEDAGYEVVTAGEIKDGIRRRGLDEEREDRTHLDDRRNPFARKAARVLTYHEGVGSLDVHVTSMMSLGLGEPDFEGEYREKVEVKVQATFYEARFAGEIFRDRKKLRSESVYKQAQRYYHEKIRKLDTKDQAVYGMLLSYVETLLPRFPKRGT